MVTLQPDPLLLPGLSRKSDAGKKLLQESLFPVFTFLDAVLGVTQVGFGQQKDMN